jgi:nucleotidyltransferase/DNA polymerase involved in DNA repair
MEACVETSSGEWRVTNGEQDEVKHVKAAQGVPQLVESLPGIEPAHVVALAKRGIRTIGTLRGIPKPVLVSVFGQAVGEQIWMKARGRTEQKAVTLRSLIPFFARR